MSERDFDLVDWNNTYEKRPSQTKIQNRCGLHNIIEKNNMLSINDSMYRAVLIFL